MRVRPLHLVCFLLLLATFGAARTATCAVQETALRAPREFLRRTAPSFWAKNTSPTRHIAAPTSVLPHVAGNAAIVCPENHPATRSVAQLTFTSSLR